MAFTHGSKERQSNHRTQSNNGVLAMYDGFFYGIEGKRLTAAADYLRTCQKLIAGYELRGPELFRSLEGSFALVLLDEVRRRIYLVKDMFGTKPLFYSQYDGALFFSSEIPGLLALAGCACDVDVGAVDTYLSLGYVPAPLTMLKDIHQVSPGHYLEIREDGEIAERRHRAAPREIFQSNTAMEWAPALRKSLVESVARRFEAHPDAGVLLSGGVDTAAIVGAASQQSIPLRTFTIGIPGQPGP